MKTLVFSPAAEADIDGEDRDAQAALAEIEATIADQPAYANLVAARVRYQAMIPFVAAQYALRGWSGPGLPEFRRERGVVAPELLEDLPEAEIRAIGNRAAALMQVSETAAGNFEPPSPSPETA